MIESADFFARGAVAFFAVALVAGLGVAAASRDLGKRLLGAGVASFAAVTLLAVLTRDAPMARGAALAVVVVALAGLALGIACLLRIREGFGGVDAGGLRLAEAADERAERGE